MSTARGRRRRKWFLLWPACALSCSGCWQEVQYQPPHVDNDRVASLQDTGAASRAPVELTAGDRGQANDQASGGAEGDEAAGGVRSTAKTVVSSVQQLPGAANRTADADAPSTNPESAVELPPALTPTPAPSTAAGPAPPTPIEPTAAGAAESAVDETNSPDAAARRLQYAWEAASAWSLAAALEAKQVSPSAVSRQLEIARVAARKLGVELPDLPETPATAVAESMRGGTGPALWKNIFQGAGLRAAACAELACRTRRLLLVYSPRREDRREIAAIRAAAIATELPPELWESLAALLDEQADYASVKHEVFRLHRSVARHLEKSSTANARP